MDDWIAYRNLGIAVAAGMLIGVERAWQARGWSSGTRVAGFRTFTLLGGLGGLAGLLEAETGPLVPAILVLAGSSVLVAGTLKGMTSDRQVSATMLVSALIALALGMLATTGRPALAIAGASVTMLILSSRERLHGIVNKLDERDVAAIARFAIIACAIFPFLPDRQMGPYGAWNPYQLWLVVVLVTGFSLAGYVANRVLGERHGTLALSVIGAMYSSTAVTYALSRRLRSGEEEPGPLLAGIALASGVMLLRALVLTALLAGFAFAPLARILFPALLVATLFGIALIRPRGTGSRFEETARNPVDIVPAFGFLLLVAAMGLATRWASQRYGTGGAATVIIASGSFDIDAAIVTMGSLGKGHIPPGLAALVLSAPIAINTGFKGLVVLVFAGWRNAKVAILALLATCLAIGSMGISQLFSQPDLARIVSF